MLQTRNVCIEKLDLIRPENTLKAILCCCFLSCMTDYHELIQYLHVQERNYYDTLRFEKRIRSYLMGRFVAKQAVAALTGEKDVTNIYIQPGIFTQPIVVSKARNIQVSITHGDDIGAALAFPEVHPLGIDLEKVNLDKREVLERQMTASEKERIQGLPITYDIGLTLLWTVKEGLSKILKTGLMTPFEIFEVSKIELRAHHVMCFYKNFAQYKAISFTVGGYMCSMVCPMKTEMGFDVHSFKENFAFMQSPNEREEI